MTTQVKLWGNSSAIRLSKEILKEAKIAPDEILDIKVKDGDIVLSKKIKHKTLEERAIPYGGKIGPYEEFDWGEPMGREFW
ncbi:MAG: hypothetical protein LBM05_01940 [Endomicrobium sp.]|nr:hypothetical protein [Endomicrobium sp.]